MSGDRPPGLADRNPDLREAGHGRPSADCLPLDDGAAAVRAGRHFVEAQVTLRGATGFVDDAALVAAELLANAVQHGEPPVEVCVLGDARLLRLEVRDASGRAPLRLAGSTSNMTGRGLALVEAVSSRWGVARAGSGKAVWAEFDADRAPAEEGDVDIDALLAGWEDLEPAVEERFTVVLGDVPTDLLLQAKAHIDNVVRELSLARDAEGADAAELPEHIARLVASVVDGFGAARDAIKRQALAAAGRGEARACLTLHLPASAADAGESYLAALEEADKYSRAARLLTLETPPDHRLFRRWYVTAVTEQLRDLAAGRSPQPVTPFEHVLLEEIRRLSVAQRISARTVRLQRVTAALARARTPQDVASAVVSVGVDVLGASGGGLLVVAADGEHLAVPGAVGYGDELVDALREERVDAPLPAATALRTGEPIWLESRDERDRAFPALRGLEAGSVSMCAVPLIMGERLLGTLRFSFATRKIFDVDERDFVLALAAQTAQSLLRTERYEAERRATVDLQRALLPALPPRVAGWDVATHYSPAGQHEAGGDFYDVIALPGGKVAAVIGDVMGRGIRAAAAMAQVRSVLRAYAVDDPAPETVFRRVDRYFGAVRLEQFVTALYLLVDPAAGSVQAVSAGHLPPLLVDGVGVRPISTPAGLPLGVAPSTRGVARAQIPPGGSLVAFTDGLVERRGEDIDDGIARVAGRLRPGADAQGLLDDVVGAAAAQRSHDDDVTVLVLGRRA